MSLAQSHAVGGMELGLYLSRPSDGEYSQTPTWGTEMNPALTQSGGRLGIFPNRLGGPRVADSYYIRKSPTLINQEPIALP